MTELSDDLLVAYVDGQLAKDQNRAIEKVLRQDEIVARRAEALQEAHGRLELAFDAILAGTLHELVPDESFRSSPLDRPAEPENKAASSTGTQPLLWVAAATAGLAGLGLGMLLAPLGDLPLPGRTPTAAQAGPFETPPTLTAGVEPAAEFAAAAPAAETVRSKSPAFGAYEAPASLTAEVKLALPPSPPPAPPIQEARSWQERAAQAHALVSRESLEVSIESQKNPYLLSFQLTKAIGGNIRGPDLRPDGYRFIRAQVLKLRQTPIAQMLYLPDRGKPLALYAAAGGEDATPVFLQEGPVGAVRWTEGGIAYLLAAEAEEGLLLRMAEKIRNEPRDDRRLQPAGDLSSDQ